MQLLLKSATIKAIVGARPLRLQPRGPAIMLTIRQSPIKIVAEAKKAIAIRVGTPGLRGPKGETGETGAQGDPGVGVPSANIRENVLLVGLVDGVNDTFTLPAGEKAIVLFPGIKIRVHVNGHRLSSTDYTMSESSGANTGFDTITILSGPVNLGDEFEADYLKA